MLLPALLAVAAPPSVVEVADGDALAWVRVPEIGALLAQLDASSFTGVMSLILPRADRAALAKAPAHDLLLAAYRRDTKLEATLWLDGGAGCAPLVTTLGEVAKRQGAGRPGISVFEAQGRCGWSPDPARAARALAAAERPLASKPEYLDLARRANGPAYGRIDVQALYGLVARSEHGAKWAGVVRRLGLEAASAVELSGKLADPRTVQGHLEVLLPKPYTGLIDALGPPLDAVWPAEVPSRASDFAVLSVRPDKLFTLAEVLGAYLAPMEFTLVRTQLNAIETQMGKRLVEDALGAGPGRLLWYVVPGHGQVEVVAVLDVADGELLSNMLLQLLTGVRDLLPQAVVERSKVGGMNVIDVGVGPALGDERWLLAFGKKQLIVATDLALLKSHQAAKGVARPLSSPPGFAHGVVADAARRVLYQAPLADQSEWAASFSERGIAVELTVRGALPKGR